MLLVHASSLYGDLLGLSFSDKTIQKSKKITMDYLSSKYT